MPQITTILAISTYCTLLTSCATLLNGPYEKVQITTLPPGATVTEKQTSKLTPSTLTLRRDRDYILTITKEGYKTETIKIEHIVSPAAAANIFGITWLGMAIDKATGAFWTLEPDNIIVCLRPLSPQERIDEANRLNGETLQNKLEALDNLKDAKLLTENQYIVLRALTIHCTQNT